jgi:hypothetical protein
MNKLNRINQNKMRVYLQCQYLLVVQVWKLFKERYKSYYHLKIR